MTQPSKTSPATRRATNKHDADIAKTRAQVHTVDNVVRVIRLVILLLFIRWYLDPVDDMVHAVAGRDTHFDFKVNIAIGITVAITVAGGALAARKMRRQSRDLRRLRERLQEYDDQLIL